MAAIGVTRAPALLRYAPVKTDEVDAFVQRAGVIQCGRQVAFRAERGSRHGRGNSDMPIHRLNRCL